MQEKEGKEGFKNPILAAGLAAVTGFMSFLGLGQMYVGKFLRGGLLLAAGLILRLLTLGDSYSASPSGETWFIAQVQAILPPLPWWLSIALRVNFAGLWLWSIFDAYHQAKMVNKTGTESPIKHH